jgi:pantetheine-phosphate adenylyltransferase
MSKYITALYPGTFDPITNGHIDVILRASKIVDKVIIAVSTSYNKKPMFDIGERCAMVESYIKQYDLRSTVQVVQFDCLLVDFAKKVGASLIVRGLRAVSDFEYEFQMSCMNSRLSSEIDTIFLPASEHNQFISSSVVKEVASLNGDISSFVIEEVATKVHRFYDKKS